MTENIYAATTHATPQKNFFSQVMGLFALAFGASTVGVFAGFFILPPALVLNPVFLIGTWIVTMGLFWFSHAWANERYGYLVLLGLAALLGVATVPLMLYLISSAGALALGKAFLATGGMFAGMALYGLTTKKNLASLGGILIAATIGLFVVAVVGMVASLFGASIWTNGLELAFSGIGMLVFAGWVAYDFQKIIREQPGVSPVFAATILFVDFVMLFRFVLHFMAAFSNRD